MTITNPERYGKGCKKCDYRPAIIAHAPYLPGIKDILVCTHCCGHLARKPLPALT